MPTSSLAVSGHLLLTDMLLPLLPYTFLAVVSGRPVRV
jgi:hypothetical protein